MSGSEEREPLWATSLARQPRPAYDPTDLGADVRVEVEEEQEPGAGREPFAGQAVVAGLLVGILALVLAMTLPSPSRFSIEDVPSSWDGVPMTCLTARLERGARAIELFHCRAVGSGRLPAGLHRSPDSRWTSDITRVPALVSEIEITRGGDVTGWAVY